MSKLEHAKRVMEANPGKPRKEMISVLMTEVGLTAAGASTYYQKLIADGRKELKSLIDQVVANATTKRRSVVDDNEIKANMAKIEAEMAEFEKNFRPHKNGLTFVAVD